MRIGVTVVVVLLTACAGPQPPTSVEAAPSRRQDLEPVIQEPEPPTAPTAKTRPDPEPVAVTETPEPAAATAAPEPKSQARYQVIAQDFAPAGKASFDVRLPAAVEEPEIRDMASEIREARAQGRNPVFVMFYLPGQQVGAGAYAAVQFRPQMNVDMLGVTPSEQAKMKASTPTGAMIGRWMDSSPIVGGVITITGDLQLEKPFKDGSVMKRKLRETTTVRGRRFDPVPASGHGDHWLLLPSGDLEIRDDEGLITTAPRMR